MAIQDGWRTHVEDDRAIGEHLIHDVETTPVRYVSDTFDGRLEEMLHDACESFVCKIE